MIRRAAVDRRLAAPGIDEIPGFGVEVIKTLQFQGANVLGLFPALVGEVFQF